MKDWIPRNQDHEFITDVLKVLAFYEINDSVWWNCDLEFFINCNDVFGWACADCEPVTKENLKDLIKACEDTSSKEGFTIWGPLLFCARQRKVRPQGAYYKHLDKQYWPLFDACGEERKIDFFNPYTKDQKYLYKKDES